MAQKVSIEYIDDIDGTPLGEDGQSVEFGFEGRNYTIDLTKKNAKKFREAMEVYVANGTKVTARKSTGRTSQKGSSVDNRAVREWARNAGYDISDRGRIPAEIVDAYNAR